MSSVKPGYLVRRPFRTAMSSARADAFTCWVTIPIKRRENVSWGATFKWVEFGLAFDLGSSMDNKQGRTGAHKIGFLCERRKIKLFFFF